MTRRMLTTAHLRGSLKIVRDTSKTAYDSLPTGETIGEFANRYALQRYSRKVESKRERARETRKQKRTMGILYSSKKKRILYVSKSSSRKSL